MQAVRILVVAMVELAVVPLLPTWWWPLHLWGAGVTLVVGLAVAARWTPLLGKRVDGTVPWWSYLLFWPWHLVVRASAWWFRRDGVLTEVAPGWWLGGWPHRGDAFETWPAVVDLTCELPRRSPSSDYLCLPTWDVTPPSPQALEAGVAFLLEHRRRGRPVLIHCAHGRGRSTVLLLAALVASGDHPGWQEALAAVRRGRPQVRLSRAQQRALERRLTPAPDTVVGGAVQGRRPEHP
jgi:protein-tyrosine phosphatase